MTHKDQNGNIIAADVRRETVDGKQAWGVNVFFGHDPATTIRRYYYATRDHARAGSISDATGQRGRVA